MDVISVVQRFKDQETCISHLEELRFGDRPYCTLCGCDHVKQRIGNKWICYGCGSSFGVLKDTIYHYTKIPLLKWFTAIALILNAKKSLSSHQLARDTGLSQNGAWTIMCRVRKEMAKELNGIRLGSNGATVEADETFIGGKPRHEPFKQQNNKRGRGTNKLAVLGAVERNGEVIAKSVDEVSGDSIYKFVKEYVKGIDGAKFISDGLAAYNVVSDIVDHEVMTRKYSNFKNVDDTLIHTNTIEGFWSIFKRAWYGSHHRYSKENADLYIAEACYKYNNRGYEDELFDYFLCHSVFAYHLIEDRWNV